MGGRWPRPNRWACSRAPWAAMSSIDAHRSTGMQTGRNSGDHLADCHSDDLVEILAGKSMHKINRSPQCSIGIAHSLTNSSLSNSRSASNCVTMQISALGAPFAPMASIKTVRTSPSACSGVIRLPLLAWLEPRYDCGSTWNSRCRRSCCRIRPILPAVIAGRAALLLLLYLPVQVWRRWSRYRGAGPTRSC